MSETYRGRHYRRTELPIEPVYIVQEPAHHRRLTPPPDWVLIGKVAGIAVVVAVAVAFVIFCAAYIIGMVSQVRSI